MRTSSAIGSASRAARSNKFFQPADDHPELRAPVADVIVADDVVAEELGDARERVAEDGRADVADVHRLGDVGRAEVDDDRAWVRGARDAEALIGEERGDALRDRVGAQGEIDEAGAGDLRRVQMSDDAELRETSARPARGFLAALLREDERDVGLVITEARDRSRR